MGASPARSWRPHLRRPARPHRAHAVCLQSGRQYRRSRPGRDHPQRIRARGSRGRRPPPGRHGEPQAGHRRDRGPGERHPHPQRGPAAAVPHRGRHRGRRADAADVPVSRPQTAGHVPQLRHPRRGLPGDARLSPSSRLPGGGDAVPHPDDAGGRARLPGPEPAEPRQLLRAGPVAAALQTAPDGGRVRALLPDRPLLP